MKNSLRAFLISLGILVLLLSAAAAQAAPGSAAAAPPAVSVAILLFDDVQIIDYSGPWEVFGEAGYRVFTVAAKAGPVTTVFGQKVIPAFTIADAPEADILLVPGGNISDTLLSDVPLVHWIQERTAHSRAVLSVCTGAFLLARIGALDGLGATTFHGAIDSLALAAPKAIVVSDKRFVDNGRIVVTAGLSSGIDGALHIVEKIGGLGAAQAVALNMEYNWDPKSDYARAAFPDKYFGFLRKALPGPFVLREGDRDRWTDSWIVSSGATPEEVLGRMGEALSGQAGWIPLGPSAGKGSASSRWKFKDPQGRTWSGAATVGAPGDSPGKRTVTFEIARAP